MNIMTKRGSLDNVITYEHYCDTVADLANIPKNQITLGSVAIVLKGEDDELEVYMADTNKTWYPLLNNAGGGGSGSLADIVYICGEGDYDPSTLQPTVEDPEENVFYLVPSGDSSPNMFEEWIYTNEAWEKFGSVGGGIQTDWEQNDSTALDYIKNRPFYEGIITTDIINETLTFSSMGYQDYVSASCSITGQNGFIEGNNYSVYIDSEKVLEGECINNYGMLGVGNDSYSVYQTNDTIYVSTGSVSVGEHEVRLEGSVESFIVENNFLENAQPDWNENNDSKLSYIKNRPFYEVDQSSFNELIRPISPYYTSQNGITSYTFNNQDQSLWSTIFSLQSVTIIIDGNKYILNQTTTGSTTKSFYTTDNMIGLSLVQTSSAFRYTIFCNDSVISSGNHNFVIGETIPQFYIKKIDEKFLPDNVIAPIDWNENDSSAGGYIENRPFYEESETTTVYLFDSDATMTVTDGATGASVTVNNVARSMVDIFVNASSRILTVNDDEIALQTRINAYPYFFGLEHDDTGRIQVNCNPVSGSDYTLYNVSISYSFYSGVTLAPGDYSVNVKTSSTTTTIHKIDPKFIPDITETSSSFTIGTSLTIGSTTINEAQLQELLGFTSAEVANF